MRQRNGYNVVTIAETRDTNYTNSHEALDPSNSRTFREIRVLMRACHPEA
jgi:hypothetical protein